MPKIACLATAGHFTRSLPTVSARMSGQSVSPSTQTSSSVLSLAHVHEDGRLSSPTLPLGESAPLIPSCLSTVNSKRPWIEHIRGAFHETRQRQPEQPKSLSDTAECGSVREAPLRSETTTDLKSSYNRALEQLASLSEVHHELDWRTPNQTSDFNRQRQVPQARPRKVSSQRENSGRQKLPIPALVAKPPAAANECQHRRSHAIVQGRMIPFCSRCRRPRQNDDDGSFATFPSSATRSGATIAVGARPLLHTIQDFPFDLRRSRVEASRLMKLP